MANEKQHVGVYGIVRRGGELLLVRKTRGPYEGKWDLPGGGVLHGEEPYRTLIRELAEEVGLKLYAQAFPLWGNLSTLTLIMEGEVEISFFHIGMIYEVSLSESDQINHALHNEDVGGAEWFSLRTLLDLELTPFAREVVRKLQSGVSCV